MKSTLAATLENAPQLRPFMDTLASHDDRGDKLAEDFFSGVDQVRIGAVEQGDEPLANAAWCTAEIAHAQSHYMDAFHRCKRDEFHPGWCSLERCEIALRSVRRHCTGLHDRFGVEHMAHHVPRFQSLFPYRYFLSPGYLHKESECSICGSPLNIFSGCQHEVGELYWGKMCCCIVKNMEVLEVSIVTDPVQKYSVLFPEGMSYNYGAIRYVIQGLASPWHAWSCSKYQVDTQELLYPGARRNDECPCASGRKYKRCCLGKTRTREHLEIVFDVPPPRGYPSYVEDARYEVPTHGPAIETRTRGQSEDT